MPISGHCLKFRDKGGRDYWRVRLDYGRDPLTGDRPQPYLAGRYTSAKAAERALARELHERDQVPADDPRRMSVDQLIVAWLETEARLSLKPGNLPTYESCCRLHLRPYLGVQVACKLSTADVERWRVNRLAAGLSRPMVGKATLHLGQAFDFGQRHGYVHHNPVRALRRLAGVHREMPVWDQAEARAFLRVAQQHSYEPLWSLALATGMRVGEILALTWDDIDFERGTLSVRRSLDKDHALGVGSPKSGRARVIELDAATRTVLSTHRAAQRKRSLKLGRAYGNRALVCCTQDGQYLSQSNVNRALRGHRTAGVPHGGLSVAAGVPYIRVHGLRHTHATLLLAAGVPVKVVSERLGHASIRITLDLYAHVLPGMQRSAADTLGEILFGVP